MQMQVERRGRENHCKPKPTRTLTKQTENVNKLLSTLNLEAILRGRLLVIIHSRCEDRIRVGGNLIKYERESEGEKKKKYQLPAKHE